MTNNSRLKNKSLKHLIKLTQIWVSLILCSCTTYRSNGPMGEVYFSTTGNYGFTTTEVSNSGTIGLASLGGSSNTIDRNLTPLESIQPATIEFMDGTRITGTIDNAITTREIIRGLSILTGIRAVRDVWKEMFNSANIVSDNNVKEDLIASKNERAKIDANVEKIRIQNPPPLEE